MNIEEIQRILPHRYPFLLIDRVLEYEAGKRAIALKNVTINEPFFAGHFPGRPIMPGVLIIEALAQTGGIVLLQFEQAAGKLAVLAGIDRVRFRRIVVPGDQLMLSVDITKIKGHIGKLKAEARVSSQLVCEAELLFSLVE